jgi:hypothetical protein
MTKHTQAQRIVKLEAEVTELREQVAMLLTERQRDLEAHGRNVRRRRGERV